MVRRNVFRNTAKILLCYFTAILMVALVAMAVDLYLGVWLETNCASIDGVCG